MKKRFACSPKAADILLKLFILGTILATAVYHFFYVWDIVMNSDMASDLIHSYYVAKGGNLLFSTQWYNSTELRTLLNYDTAFDLLFRISNDWRLVWTVGCISVILVLVASVYLLGKRLGFTNLQCDGIVLLYLIPGCSSLLGSVTITYPVYTLFIAASTIFFTLYIDLRKSAKGKKAIFKAGILFLMCFLGGMSGIRMILLTIIPAFAAEAYLWFLDERDTTIQTLEELKKTLTGFLYRLRLCILAAFPMMAGLIFLEKVLEPRYGTANGVAINFQPDQISAAVTLIPVRFLQIFGAQFAGRGLSIRGLAGSVQYGIAICAILAVTCYFFRLLKGGVRDKKDFLSFVGILCALITLVLLCLTEMGYEGLTARYFAIGFWSLPYVIVSMTNRFQKYSVKRILGIAMICAMVFTSDLFAAKDILNGLSYMEPEHITFLRESDYTYGAATFWNANVTTVKTDGKIEMKSVTNDDELSFFPWLQYKEHAEADPEFLLLTTEEYELRTESGLAVPGQIVYSDEVYIILDIFR